MEGVPTLRQLVQEGHWMTKIDLKDAYTVVPIHHSSRPFLSFKHRGTVYQYTSLPFGMSVAPTVFSKLMRYALEPLRKAGIRLGYYLDNISIMNQSREGLKNQTEQILAHLQKLGFVINWKKSGLEPVQVQEYLGFIFDTRSMILRAPSHKISKLRIRIRQALKTSHSCRWIASLLGKMTSLIPAVGEALLHVRFFQRDLARSLRAHRCISHGKQYAYFHQTARKNSNAG